MKVKIIRKPSKFWIPGTDVVKAIVKTYKDLVKENDFVILSDKALSTAYGYIYDESAVNTGLTYRLATYIISRIFWGRIFNQPFSKDLLSILRYADIDMLAKHKRLALIRGGLKHVIKPVSEAGIDTTNLPYQYVSLPIPSAKLRRIVDAIYDRLTDILCRKINLLIMDTDKTYKLKFLRGVAFSTRPSNIIGIIDLGGLAYFIGKKFRNIFSEYPTPVDYRGVNIGLENILLLSKIVEGARGYGAGRNIREMTNKFGYHNYADVKWRDLMRIKHYPVIIARILTKN